MYFRQLSLRHGDVFETCWTHSLEYFQTFVWFIEEYRRCFQKFHRVFFLKISFCFFSDTLKYISRDFFGISRNLFRNISELKTLRMYSSETSIKNLTPCEIPWRVFKKCLEKFFHDSDTSPGFFFFQKFFRKLHRK